MKPSSKKFSATLKALPASSGTACGVSETLLTGPAPPCPALPWLVPPPAPELGAPEAPLLPPLALLPPPGRPLPVPALLLPPLALPVPALAVPVPALAVPVPALAVPVPAALAPPPVGCAPPSELLLQAPSMRQLTKSQAAAALGAALH